MFVVRTLTRQRPAREVRSRDNIRMTTELVVRPDNVKNVGCSIVFERSVASARPECRLLAYDSCILQVTRDVIRLRAAAILYGNGGDAFLVDTVYAARFPVMWHP